MGQGIPMWVTDGPGGHPARISWWLSRGRILRWQPGSWTLVHPDRGVLPMGAAPMTAPSDAESTAALEHADRTT